MRRVVLIHGAADSGASFGAVLDALVAAGYAAESYDRRGCGERWAHLPDSMADHVDDLVGLLDERPAVLVGHSMGGVVALGAALRRPDLLRALGLFETALPWASWWSEAARQEMIEDVERSAARALDGSDPARLARRYALWETCRRDVHSMLNDWMPWSEVTVPVHVATGTASTSRSAADALRLAAALGCPVTRIEGAPHAAHRTHPEGFAAWVQTVAA